MKAIMIIIIAFQTECINIFENMLSKYEMHVKFVAIQRCKKNEQIYGSNLPTSARKCMLSTVENELVFGLYCGVTYFQPLTSGNPLTVCGCISSFTTSIKHTISDEFRYN